MADGRMKTWYRIRAARKTAEIRIYEEIGAWGVTAKQFADDLAALGGMTDLSVRINSLGGDVFDAIAMYNALSRHPARIVTHVDGICASAATLVALAADEVRMADNGLWMIHEPWTVSGGNADQLQKSADLLDSIAEQIVGIYARKTGADPADIREQMREETWLDAEQALEAGYVDAIDAPLKAVAKADLSRFKHPPQQREVPAMSEPTQPAETAESVDSPPTPQEPSNENPNPPAAPDSASDALAPSAVAKACLDANEPGLIPALLSGKVTAAALHQRLANAAEVRRLCAIARQPERAAEYVAAELSPDQAKLRLWDGLVAMDRALGEIDTTPPAAPKKPTTDPTAIARAALVYQQAQQSAGVPLSFAEAVAHIAKTGVPS